MDFSFSAFWIRLASSVRGVLPVCAESAASGRSVQDADIDALRSEPIRNGANI